MLEPSWRRIWATSKQSCVSFLMLSSLLLGQVSTDRRAKCLLAWKLTRLMLMYWCGCTRMIQGQVLGDRWLDTTPVGDVRSVPLACSQSSSDANFVTEQLHSAVNYTMSPKTRLSFINYNFVSRAISHSGATRLTLLPNLLLCFTGDFSKIAKGILTKLSTQTADGLE